MTLNPRTALILALVCSTFASTFMSNSITIAVASISDQYGINPDYITYAVSSYVIAATACMLPASALVNKFGCRRIFIAGAVGAALTALAVAHSPNFTVFVIMRGIQGMVNSLLFVTGPALIALNVDRQHRGEIMGLQSSSVFAGITMAPSLGGFLTDCLGWQSMFYVSMCLYLSAPLCARRIRDDRGVTDYYPYFKMTVAVFGFAAFLYALTNLNAGHSHIWLLLAGIAALIWYFLMEQRSKHPLMRISLLFDNRVLGLGLSASCLSYMANFSVALLLSLHLQLVLGYSASHAGLVLILQPAIQCLMSPWAGRLTVRHDPHLIAFAGFVSAMLGTAVFAFVSAATPLYLLFAGQVLTGFGVGLYSAPVNMVVMNSVDREHTALASALLSVTRNSGMACSMAILAAIFSVFIISSKGTDAYASELSGALTIAFTLSAATGAGAALSSLLGYFSARKASV